ncbi:MAG: prepilin-type N-terminal cleavage/methylation domain-containing protein [Gallionella sp.]
MLTLTDKQQGMTLLEVIISLVVAGGMMALGLPVAGDWIDANRIKATADSMLNGLQLTKMEAVRRNTRSRFVLTDTPTFSALPNVGGQAGDWEMCTADSTGSFVGNRDQVWRATENGTPVRIGVSTAALATQNFNQPLAAGAGLTGYPDTSPAPQLGCQGTTATTINTNVTFDAMGRVFTGNLTPNVTRIDILNARTGNAQKRLVITINPQGQIKLCNPASLDPNQRC